MLSSLGTIEIERQRYGQAEDYLQEGLALAREMGHRERTCGQLLKLGELTIAQDDYVRAAAYLAEGLALARETQYPLYIAAMLQQQGELARKQEQWEAAADALHEALASASKINIPELRGMCCYGLARVAAAQGDLAEARRLGQEALALCESVEYYMTAEVRDWLAALPPVPVS